MYLLLNLLPDISSKVNGKDTCELAIAVVFMKTQKELGMRVWQSRKENVKADQKGKCVYISGKGLHTHKELMFNALVNVNEEQQEKLESVLRDPYNIYEWERVVPES